MPTPDDLNPVSPGLSGVALKNQHLLSHQQIAKAINAIQAWLGLGPNLGGSPLLSRIGITPNIGPILIVGASYEDEKNFFYINGGTGPFPYGNSEYSDGNSWVHNVCSLLNQPCVGRYTPAGSASNPKGNNYAVASQGSFTGAHGIPQQIAQLIADYGGTLPQNCVVILGAYWPNDLGAAVSTYGGQWPAAGGPQTWAVSNVGGFTIPASGNINITVVSSAGAVIGPGTNNISFTNQGYGPFLINATPDGTHIQVATNPTYATLTVPNNALIETSSAGFINFITGASAGNLAGAIANLVAALPSNGLLVIVNSPDISLFPVFAAYSSAMVHNTWSWYSSNIIAPLITTSSPKVAVWDMNSVLSDLVASPSKYGIKNVLGGLGGVPGTPVPAGRNADDYAFWDGTTDVAGTGTHPTGAAHLAYATGFLPWLKFRKRVTPY